MTMGLLLWSLLAQVAILAAANDDTLYLYLGRSKHIQEYTGENDFLKSKGAKVVEFYSPHCPVCVEFQLEFIHLAKTLKSDYIGPAVEFYAVSCDAHGQLCDEFGIDATPSLYIFKEGSEKGILAKHDEKGHYSSELLANQLDQMTTRASRRMDAVHHSNDKDEGNEDDDDVGDRVPYIEGEESANDEDDDFGDDNDRDEYEAIIKKGLPAAAQDPPKRTPAKLSNDVEGSDDAKGNSEDDEDGHDEDSQEYDVIVRKGLPASAQAMRNKRVKDASEASDDDEDEAGDNDEEAGNDDRTGDDEKYEEEDLDEYKQVMQKRANRQSGDDDDKYEKEDLHEFKQVMQKQANYESGDDDDKYEKDDLDEYGEVIQKGAAAFVPQQGGWKAGPPGLHQHAGGGRLWQRRHDAGHQKARNQQKKLDRFKAEMQERLGEYERKRNGLGRFVRRDNRRDKRGNMKRKHDSNAMTPGMKAFTPGTPEFGARKNIMENRLKKAYEKRKIFYDPRSVKVKNESLPYRKEARKQTVARKAVSTLPLVGQRFRMTPEEELITDVSLSFFIGLEKGVKFKGNGGLSSTESEALRNYLDMLHVALPPEWSIHKMIDDARRRFETVTKSSISFRNFLRLHAPKKRSWSPSCRKSSTPYTCGFWKLLHVATVGIAEQRGGLNLLEAEMIADESNLFSPIDAADTIRDYIESFFSCEPCKEHFIANYDDCDKNRRCDRLTEDAEDASPADWKELPVWLWEVHNEISVRVLKEKEERAKRFGGSALRKNAEFSEIVALWPHIDQCFLCFNNDGTWDESDIFQYLETIYWPDAEFDAKSERLITYDLDEDFRMGVFLWILVFVILFVIYYAVAKTSPAKLQQQIYQAKRIISTGREKQRSN